MSGKYMIVYDKLWKKMEEAGVSQYRILNSGISHSTLARLKNNQPVNTESIEKLCRVLDCRVEDIMEYVKEQ